MEVGEKTEGELRAMTVKALRAHAKAVGCPLGSDARLKGEVVAAILAHQRRRAREAGPRTCRWDACRMAAGRWLVSAGCGAEFALSRSSRILARMRGEGESSALRCPYCGRAVERGNEE